MGENGKFVVSDIPPKWRAMAEFLTVPTRSEAAPRNKPTDNSNFYDILQKENQNTKIIPKTAAELMLDESHLLIDSIKNCEELIHSAEKKRIEIASNAELMNGACQSQITEEQRLATFVNAIDKILIYYDELDKISLDLKSSQFSVLLPDFPQVISKISDGIEFFKQNTLLKEAQLHRLKYEALLSKAAEKAKIYISNTFKRVIFTSENGKDSFQKFTSIAPSIKRLFLLFEKFPNFNNLLLTYKEARVTIITKTIMKNENIISILIIFNLIEDEYKLSKDFFNYGTIKEYEKCFESLILEIFSIYSSTLSSQLYQINDIDQLCQLSLELKSNRIEQNIYRIPFCSDKVHKKVQTLLLFIQERLTFIVNIQSKQISQQRKVIYYLPLLYISLPNELFNDCSFQLISNELTEIENTSNEIENEIEHDSYLLNYYINLYNLLKEFDYEIIGYKITSKWKNIFSSNIKINVLNDIKSKISIKLQSLSTCVTQFLLNPILNLKARGSYGTKQIESAVEGTIFCFRKLYQTEISQKISKYLNNENEKFLVVNEIKERLNMTLADVIAEIPNNVIGKMYCIKEEISELKL